jgi:hypothetical protein
MKTVVYGWCIVSKTKLLPEYYVVYICYSIICIKCITLFKISCLPSFTEPFLALS